jgi:hypothetical protein
MLQVYLHHADIMTYHPCNANVSFGKRQSHRVLDVGSAEDMEQQS